ncbi:unnamed protein product [Cuscuta epithymum]|uniref:Uncharacterized protein n=1 Tax=Cuscuta epithymum TaxID=186058 RepID=A0AAV0DD78_9ASTE|nr:unnamed protein product [Cuscuta epithymum]
MGISFRVSKTGTRYRPRIQVQPDTDASGDKEDVVSAARTQKLRNSALPHNDSISSSAARKPEATDVDESISGVSENEVSFSLNLYLDGYSIGKPSENDSSGDVPRILHPYDRTSETLFSAIESGRLPSDILDDMPCKYINGALVCEVRDYRKCLSEAGQGSQPVTLCPLVTKVCLKMSLENVVKDIPLISNSAWTYGDLMEVESRILKAIQPALCLNPIPKLDRLSNNPVSSKLNLAISTMRRKRLREISRPRDGGATMQHTVNGNAHLQSNSPNNMGAARTNGFCSDVSIPPASPLVSNHIKNQIGAGSPRIMQDQRQSVINSSAVSPMPDAMMNSASFHGKRENPEGQSHSVANLNKKARFGNMAPDCNHLQNIGSQIDSFNGPDSQWKNSLLHQQPIQRVAPYGNTDSQKCQQQMFEGGMNPQEAGVSVPVGQQVARYGLKEEPTELDKPMGSSRTVMQTMDTEMGHMEPQVSRPHQKATNQFLRPGFPQTTHWNNASQPLLENSSRKDDLFQKRKQVQSPHFSGGGLPQSPLSSKSGDFSSGSVGPHQYGPAVTSGLTVSLKEKSGMTSLASGVSDSMQRQHQAHIAAAKRRTNSLPKTPVMSGVGSPASVSNMSVPINASSPPVGNQLSVEQVMLERFSKIEMIAARYQLNFKKNKGDERAMQKTHVTPTPQMQLLLSNDSNNETVIDEVSKLSKSVIQGSANVCKRRVLTFTQTERVFQGGGTFSVVPKARTKMIMSEKPSDGTVAMHIGEIDDNDYFAAEDYLPTLPNAHFADLLASQYCSLMIHEGHFVEDNVHTKPMRAVNHHNNSTSGQPPNMHGLSPGNDMLQHPSEGVPSGPSAESVRASNGINASFNSTQNSQGTRSLPPGTTHALQQLPPRTQQPEMLPPPQQPLNQQHSLIQQQHPQFQRSSSMMMAANHSNGGGSTNHLAANKPSPIPLQILQQQQQRKMMMGLGNVGMGNMNSGMVGLGGLASHNVMGGMGVRGGSGISAPMGSIPAAMGNLGQNAMNLGQASNLASISQQLRSGQLMASKLRMVQNRINMMGGGPQSSIAGMTGGGRQMLPTSANSLSMLGPSALNRAATSINPLQRTSLATMGPPKLISSGMNLYMNQQQLQQIQQQQQMHHQRQIQQQQTQLEMSSSSPLQPVVVSPPQQVVGSPSSSMGIIPLQQMNQQQQLSPQQMGQRPPMSPQLSSGAIHHHTMSGGNHPEGACPASPQLSSQTMGSVGSMTNSPMEQQLQCVNKSNSAS